MIEVEASGLPKGMATASESGRQVSFMERPEVVVAALEQLLAEARRFAISTMRYVDLEGELWAFTDAQYRAWLKAGAENPDSAKARIREFAQSYGLVRSVLDWESRDFREAASKPRSRS